MTLSSSACPMMLCVRDRLLTLQQVLTFDLFQLAWQGLAERLNSLLYQDVRDAPQPHRRTRTPQRRRGTTRGPRGPGRGGGRIFEGGVCRDDRHDFYGVIYRTPSLGLGRFSCSRLRRVTLPRVSVG